MCNNNYNIMVMSIKELIKQNSYIKSSAFCRAFGLNYWQIYNVSRGITSATPELEKRIRLIIKRVNKTKNIIKNMKSDEYKSLSELQIYENCMIQLTSGIICKVVKIEKNKKKEVIAVSFKQDIENAITHTVRDTRLKTDKCFRIYKEKAGY